MLNRDNTPVVILCGGKGTRIKEVGGSLPKPMVPIGRWPILWHIMKGYHSQGFKDFILCLGHGQEHIRDFFLNYSNYASNFKIHQHSGRLEHVSGSPEDWRVSLIDTGEESQTGRRLDIVRPLLENSPAFMLTYGDGVSNVNFDELYASHSKHQGIVGTLTGSYEWSKYGKLVHDEEGRITCFKEKPRLADPINCGFMYLERAFLDNPLLKENLPVEKTLENFCNSGKMAVHLHNGFWQSMDEPREYDYLNTLWREGRAPWKIW